MYIKLEYADLKFTFDAKKYRKQAKKRNLHSSSSVKVTYI